MTEALGMIEPASGPNNIRWQTRAAISSSGGLTEGALGPVRTLLWVSSNAIPASAARRLNEVFYSAAPAAYFEFRMRALAAEDEPGRWPDGLADVLGYNPEPTENATPASAHRPLQAAEGEVLVHHIGESLLRLFLAHREPDPCPWAAIVRLRKPGALPTAIRETILGASHEDLIAQAGRALLGEPDREWNFGEDLRAEVLENAVAHLRWHARAALDADLYNAAKHGFSVQAGFTRFDIEVDGDEDDEPLSFAGPTLHYLVGPRRARTELGTRDRGWEFVCRFTDPREQAAFAYVGIQLIDAIWTTARQTRLDDCLGADRLRLVRGPTPKEIIAARDHELNEVVEPISLFDERPPAGANRSLRMTFHDRTP